MCIIFDLSAEVVRARVSVRALERPRGKKFPSIITMEGERERERGGEASEGNARWWQVSREATRRPADARNRRHSGRFGDAII